MVSSAGSVTPGSPCLHTELLFLLQNPRSRDCMDAPSCICILYDFSLLCGLDRGSFPGLDYSMNLASMLDALSCSDALVLRDTCCHMVSWSREVHVAQDWYLANSQGWPAAILPTANSYQDSRSFPCWTPWLRLQETLSQRNPGFCPRETGR